MYFINSSFFTGEIFISNVGEYCDNSNMDLNIFISQKETEALQNTLGNCLFKELIEQLEYSEKEKRFVLKPDAENKWEWLINGHKYEHNSNCCCGCGSNVWNGIVFTTPVFNQKGELKKSKQSYLAYWIYFQRSFSKNTHSTGTGEAVNLTENATMISNEFKRKQAFNKFFELVQAGNGNLVSLYQFLADNRDFYPSWSPTIYKPLNYFDI